METLAANPRRWILVISSETLADGIAFCEGSVEGMFRRGHVAIVPAITLANAVHELLLRGDEGLIAIVFDATFPSLDRGSADWQKLPREVKEFALTDDSLSSDWHIWLAAKNIQEIPIREIPRFLQEVVPTLRVSAAV